MKKIVIVGGGLLGLGTAWNLSGYGDLSITIIEKDDGLGGMSSYASIGPETWDKFYHVILSSDKKTLKIIKDLDLEDRLFWTESKSGFYGKGKLVSMTTVIDFFRFPFLNLWDKFRLGVGILYSSKISNPEKLEKIYVKTWMTKIFGRRVYERIWDPLLRSKLGSGKEKTSASFIWATIKRLYGAREDSANKVEKMGHIHGGYELVLKTWERMLREQGVNIVTGEEVLALNSDSSMVMTEKKFYEYDDVIFTCSSKIVLKTLRNVDKKDPYWSLLAGQEYLGVRCGVFLLRKSLSPYYVINLLDEALPFTGIIESTNIIGTEELHGNHLVYLPHYSPQEELYKDSDEDMLESFIDGLKKVFPEFSRDDIIASHLVKEDFVQPLYVLEYGNKIPRFQTPQGNIWVANTSMVRNATLNNNATLELAERLSEEIKKA